MPPYRLETALIRKVARDCMITFGANRYSVPWRYVGQTVQIEFMGDEIRIMQVEEVIATHQSSPAQADSGRTHY